MDEEYERTVRGRKFANETVAVDGTKFIDCEFKNCTLTFSGGNPFRFDNSPIEGSVFGLIGAAENTLNALNLLYNTGYIYLAEHAILYIRNLAGEAPH